MRVAIFLIIVLLAVPTVFLTVPAVLAVDCCVDQIGLVCIEDEDLAASCTGGDMTYYPGSLCSAVPVCKDVCCCADPAVVGGADEWNAIAGNVEKTKLECDSLGPGYDDQPRTDDCVLLCSGTGGGGGTTYHTVSGTITNETGGAQKGATVFVPFPFGTLQDETAADGAYLIEEVPELRGSVIATREGCVPASSPSMDFDEDKIVDLQINCNPMACTPLDPTIQSLEPVRGTDTARMTITFDDPCQLWVEFIITGVRKIDGQIIEDIPPFTTTDTTVTIEDLEPESEYCFKVAAQYSGGFGVLPGPSQRSEMCFTTGVSECMDGIETEWCDNELDPSEVHACDDTNQQVVVETCNSGQFCTLIGSGAGAYHGCVARPFCEQCNGIFGILGTLTDTVFALIHGSITIPCDDDSLHNYCFEDRSLTAVDKYRSCGEIYTCEGYNGEDACTENPCGVPGDCEWRDVLIELGKGVCQSTTETADCGSCERIFGACNKELCESIGANDEGPSDCYFDAVKNGYIRSDPAASRCIHRDDMACRFYDTEADCLGDSPGVDVDAVYTGDGDRQGGSHALLETSNDIYGIGRCAWEPEEYGDSDGRCYKDADGWTTIPEDDCIESGAIQTYNEACLVDSTPPTTSLVLGAAVLGVHELPSIEYYVMDNFYPADQIVTQFCIGPVGSDCYPTLSLTDAVLEAVDLDDGESGEFVIRYYSFDPSGNLEPVQEQTVTLIEQGYPWVSHAEIVG